MNIKNKIKFIFITFLALLPWHYGLAGLLDTEEIDNQVNIFNQSAGYADADPWQIIGSAIATFLSILGVIFIILMLYGGYNWMIARGEEEKVTEAKKTIRNAIIGLIIVISSYAIWYFIYTYLITGTPTGGVPVGT